MNKINILIIALIISFFSCSPKKEPIFITIENSLDKDRAYETLELTADFLKINDLSSVGIKNKETNTLEITQLVDNDGDGTGDLLLFQPKIAANTKKTFEIVSITSKESPKTKNLCFSRFVPERTDDYTWENNKVAFRIFGPTAQKMKEANVAGGTLSSGVDAWLKKVEYPIINKWYKKELETAGTYHEDNGEGLDNFHVGVSRGVGGIAVKKDTTYYISKNYTKWKTITTGPLRTSFYVEYESWDAGGKLIKESRIISLDLGSNLSKFEINIEGSNTISAGLTLHEKDGIVTSNENNNWISYWQPHGSSELGTAIIAAPNTFIGYDKYDTKIIDLSNAYAHLKVNDNKVVYYAGFGWKESRQFKNQLEWENYLDTFSRNIQNPLLVSIVKK